MSFDQAVQNAFSDKEIGHQQLTCPHCGRSWHRHLSEFRTGERVVCVYDEQLIPVPNPTGIMPCGRDFAASENNCRTFNKFGVGIPNPKTWSIA